MSIFKSTILRDALSSRRWSYGVVSLWMILMVATGMTELSWAQYDAFSPDWFQEDQSWIKIEVGEVNNDRVYEIDANQLMQEGMPAAQVSPEMVKFYFRGREIPLEIVTDGQGALESGDKIRFFVPRRTGQDELWAYRYRSQNQSSDYYSIYTDTQHIWVTWSAPQGKRYSSQQTLPNNIYYEGYRDTVHVEQDQTGYYIGHDIQAELSTYSPSEGIYWHQFDVTGRQQSTFSIDTVKTSIPGFKLINRPVHLRAHVAGLTTSERQASIQLYSDQNGVITYHDIGSESWGVKSSRFIEGSINPGNLVDFKNLNVRISVLNEDDDRNTPNKVNFDWLEYSYFRGFQIREKEQQHRFWLKSDGNKSVQFQQVPDEDTIKVYLPSRSTIFQTLKDTAANTASFRNPTPANKNERYVVVRNDEYESVKSISAFRPRRDLSYYKEGAEYVILTRETFAREAQIYADYRAQQNGLSTKLFFASDIWDYFDYGARRPIAIRRFIHYAMANWEIKPKFVFILADGQDQLKNSTIQANQIPPFGFPASDSWFGMNFNGPEDWELAVPIGRITARSSNDILGYLNKVQSYEGERPQLEPWQKKVAFLSGGNNTTEQQLLANYNRQFASIAAQSLVAADTTSFKKTTNQPLDGSRRQELRELINQGTFILHFFGHTSPDSWDLLTDNPETYKNKDRPNVVLSLGCYSGQFASSTNRIISEEFVFAPNASVAYIGGAGQGYPSALARYASSFYRTIFQDTTETLGEVNRQTIDYLIDNVPADIDLALMQNTIILGDPGLQLAYPKKPDYSYDTDPVALQPDPTNVSDSTLTVDVTLRNLGIRTQDQVNLQLKHIRPQRSPNTYQQILGPIARTKQVRFQLPLVPDDAGQHEFHFQIDPFSEFDEVSKANNSYDRRHVVYSTGVDLLYPKQFGVITSLDPTFVVSSPTASSGETFVFEVDTLNDFSNPLTQEQVQSNGIRIEWKPSIDWEPGQTYWWRSRVQEATDSNWRTASFVVDTTREGYWWHQNTKQYEENSLSPSIAFENQEFDFAPVRMDISTSSNTWLHAYATNRTYSASTFVNGVEYGRRNISFHMTVIDGSTGNVLKNQHYDIHPGIFTNTGAANYDQFIRDINNIKEGDFVVVRVRNFYLVRPERKLFRDDGGQLEEALRSIGGFKAGGGVSGDLPSQLTTADGYILFGKKGVESPDEVSEYVIREGAMRADTVLRFQESEGTMLGQKVGPVKSWNRLQYQADLTNNTAEVDVEIRGMESVLEESDYIETFGQSNTDQINVPIDFIDAQRFPYIEMKAILQDPSQRSTPQLEHWSVQYNPLPEIALDPTLVEVNSDTVEQGFPYKLSIAANNIGFTRADTVFVEYVNIYQSQPETLAVDTLLNLGPGQQRTSNVEINTLGRLGNHQLIVSLSDQFQDELTYNNFYGRDYVVRDDTTSPGIEVFVDSRYLPPVESPITDPENPSLPFVQKQPTIDIYWKDNNPSLRLTDSTLVNVELFGEEDNPTVYRVGSPELTFQPADQKGKRNEAYAQFRPDLTNYRDTVLTMRVNARDQSGNVAEQDGGYTVSFKVTDEVGITSLYPYPNPMSNFTNFAFQLHGASPESVEKLQLRLYTLSGRPVRGFNLVEDQYQLRDGQLQIGWNILRWDGTTESGQPLANGVYLYDVLLIADGERVEVNNGEVEKLVIIR
ncbi:MAG: C25 family cysteine peptidase [Bacteroidota bacterium]